MRHALMLALLLVASTAALPACGASDSPSTSTTPDAHLGSTVPTKTVETTAEGKGGSLPGTKALSDETARLKAQALQSSSMFGNTLSSIGAGLPSGLSSFQTEAGRTTLEHDLKQLEAEARNAQASTQSEEDFIQQMLDLIRDIREKLAAIQAAQGDTGQTNIRG